MDLQIGDHALPDGVSTGSWHVCSGDAAVGAGRPPATRRKGRGTCTAHWREHRTPRRGWFPGASRNMVSSPPSSPASPPWTQARAVTLGRMHARRRVRPGQWRPDTADSAVAPTESRLGHPGGGQCTREIESYCSPPVRQRDYAIRLTQCWKDERHAEQPPADFWTRSFPVNEKVLTMWRTDARGLATSRTRWTRWTRYTASPIRKVQ